MEVALPRRRAPLAAAKCGCARAAAAQTANETASTAERDPGAAERDERAADRRPEHADDVARHPLQRVRLLQPPGADGLRHEPDLGGDHEAGADAVERLQRDSRPIEALTGMSTSAR